MPTGTFETASEAVTNGIYDLSRDIKTVRRLAGRCDKAGDDAHSLAKAEQQVTDSLSETTAKIKRLQGDVRTMTEWPDQDATQRFTQQKLAEEYRQLLVEFQTLQQDTMGKLRRAKDRSKAALDASTHSGRPDERSPLLSYQEQSQVLDIVNQEEVDFQTDLIAEREADIASIQRGVREVNSIFRDIGALVSEQGVQIDSVEENISNVATQTQGASKQLTKAEDYQRWRSKCSCIVLVVLIVILLLIVLIAVS